jgi:hypothetical protein
MRHRAFVLACIALMAAVTGTSTGSAHGSARMERPAQRESAGRFSQRAVNKVIAGLARAGIGVYRSGSDEPLVAPEEPVSPLRLSESQARNAALGAWARAGMTGADLDELIPIAAEDQTIVPPASALIAAYVKVAKTPGAKLARTVMGRQDWSNVHAAVFPALVLDLFVSDVVTSAAGSSPLDSPRTSLVSFRAPAGVPAQPTGGACSATQNFVNQVVQTVFAAIPKINPPDPSSVSRTFGSFFGSIINTALQIGATVVNGLVQGAQFAVVNGIKVLIQPVLNAVASIAGVVAVIAEVGTTLQPWTLVLRADPSMTRKAVGSEKGLPGAFHLSVQTVGPSGDWPRDVADCARVAGVTLPPLKPRDAPVRWNLAGVPNFVRATSPTETTLNDASAAELHYETASEPEETAKRGEERTGLVAATAQVRRTELDALQASLVNLLFSQIPALIGPIVTPVLRGTLQPAIDNALAALVRLHDPAPAAASVKVVYHEPPKPKETPAGCGGSSGPSTSGDWTIMPVVSCQRIGARIDKVGGLKGKITFALLVDHPHMQLDLSTRDGKTTVSGVELVGIKGILIDFGVGVANAATDNMNFRFEVPVEIEVPVRPSKDGMPRTLKVGWSVVVKTALVGNNSTLLARGRYGLSGPLGVRNGKVETPTLRVRQSLIDSISGITLGPSGIDIAIRTRFAAGADAPDAAKGAFVALTASFGVTNGSSLGAPVARCHGATLDLGFAGGQGKTAVRATIFHRQQVLPDVALCA